MLAYRASRLLRIALAALSLSACDYDCGIVARTYATGTIRDAAGVTLGTAQVDLTENLNPTYQRLSAGVMGLAHSAGAPLKGHVTRARVVTETGELIAEIPTGTTSLYVDAVVAVTMDVTSDSEYARVRSALLTTRAKLILNTDLPGRELIEATVTEVHDLPSSVQSCRFTA